MGYSLTQFLRVGLLISLSLDDDDDDRSISMAQLLAGFWGNFGAVLKEGLYADGDEHRDTLLSLTRFKSTDGDGLVSLAEYVARMKPGQDSIYYITGENHEAVAASPHLEGFKAKGVEVLLLSDPIDDFWISAMFDGFEGKAFKSATRGGTDLSKIGVDTEDAEGEEPFSHATKRQPRP